MKALLTEAMKMGAKYSVHFIDSPDGVFTAPVLLTEYRIKMLQDHSIEEIRLHFDNSQWMEE